MLEKRTEQDTEEDEYGEAYVVKDPEAFASNLARVIEESGKAWAAYLEPREKGAVDDVNVDELADVIKTLSHVGEYWLSDPKRALEAQTRLWMGFMNLWTQSVRRFMGEPSKPAAEPAKGDKRFEDPEWRKNEFFNFCKQVYLLTSNWAEELVAEAADLDEHTRHKAGFYVKQIANAFSPSNFIMTNPELLRETLNSNGDNLVKGMKMLAEDIRAGHGDLKIRQTDPTGFEVGKDLALTPGKVVHQNDVCQVIQYKAQTEKVLKRPLLIVPPWINKFYILDLNPEKSFIKWAVEQGHSVFVISWINPNEKQAQKSFEHYMKEGIIEALDVVEDCTGAKEINTIGYCVGGTLLSATLGWAVQNGENRIASATFFTTQVDFTHAGDLRVFIDEEQVAALESKMGNRGYLEGRRMANAFNMLRSNDLIWPYVINNYLRGREPFPFDLLYWNADSTRMPAANHSCYLRNCYLENNLSQGRMVVDNTTIDLSKVTIPIYNLATKEDHIAPAKSVYLGSKSFGGPVKFVLAGSGHIAGVINPPKRNKYQYWTNGPVEGELEDWQQNSKETEGSWWPDWHNWLKEQDKTLVKAPSIGGGKFKPIEDAPGSYVKEKA
jgi:polyhydroxyalkanoate synthase